MSIQINTPNLISISCKMTEESAEMISGVQSGETQLKSNLICIMSRQIQIRKCQVNIPGQEKKVRKANFLQRAITQLKVGQPRQNENLTCIMSRQIHIWNFKWKCQKMTKKSPENEFFAKGNNSCKSRWNATKVKLDLYYVKTNSYMKFQLNTSKDDKEKSGKRIFCKGQ